MPKPRFWTKPRLFSLLATVGILIVIGAAFWFGPDAPESKITPDLRQRFQPGTSIVICGETVSIGTPVILWSDPVGFNAYLETCFSVAQALPIEPEGRGRLQRYGTRAPTRLDRKTAAAVQKNGWSRDALARQIHQFILHYDAVGTSTRCFRALHDRRGLSCHFLLDLDGTIYQTLDVREEAFQASGANAHSIGVEMANLGALATPKLFEGWYHQDDAGVILVPPAHVKPGNQWRDDLVLRPARPKPESGRIQGSKFVQYDFTPEQYAALARLTAALASQFPRIKLRAPTDGAGKVITSTLPEKDQDRFEGVLAHWHLSRGKFDPGPAFQWDLLLSSARGFTPR